jgi:hypothetical protein
LHAREHLLKPTASNVTVQNKDAHRSRLITVAKLVYVLIDAADHAGNISSPEIQRSWLELKEQLLHATPESKAEALYTMLMRIYESGALKGTWIETRWKTLEERIRTEADLRESRAPW